MISTTVATLPGSDDPASPIDQLLQAVVWGDLEQAKQCLTDHASLVDSKGTITESAGRTFTDIKPAVELIGKGNILPNTGGLHFPFRAVNLNAVNVKVVQVYEDKVQNVGLPDKTKDQQKCS